MGNVGSGQQLVTWYKDDPGANEKLWQVRPYHNNNKKSDTEYDSVSSKKDSCTKPGQPILCDSYIRLTHLSTGRNLHSHHVPSALSRQQEVSAYGNGDRKGDAGDNWKVVCTKYSNNKSNKEWKRGDVVKLQHVDTNSYLGSSTQAEFNSRTCGRNCPIMNHLEAFA